MNLEEFVSESLRRIVEGVDRARKADKRNSERGRDTA